MRSRNRFIPPQASLPSPLLFSPSNRTVYIPPHYPRVLRPPGGAAIATKKSRVGSSSSSSSSSSFSVRFSFLPALGIVAVCPPAGAPKGILANLFPNDTGKDTPNPANHHGKAARASPLGIFRYPADVPCRPYRWAQWMAGLHFPPPAASAVSSGEPELLIEPSVRSAMAALRSRVRTSAALDAQLKALSGGKGPSPLAGTEGELPEATGSVELSRCVASWELVRGSVGACCTHTVPSAVCVGSFDAPSVGAGEGVTC